jgi:hypothetical protein
MIYKDYHLLWKHALLTVRQINPVHISAYSPKLHFNSIITWPFHVFYPSISFQLICCMTYSSTSLPIISKSAYGKHVCVCVCVWGGEGEGEDESIDFLARQRITAISWNVLSLLVRLCVKFELAETLCMKEKNFQRNLRFR